MEDIYDEGPDIDYPEEEEDEEAYKYFSENLDPDDLPEEDQIPEEIDNTAIQQEIEPSDDNKFTRRLYISSENLKEYISRDFRTASDDYITLVEEDEDNYIMVLFIWENIECQDYLKKFLQMSNSCKDNKFKFKYCNLEYEEGIRNGFRALSSLYNHPLFWCTETNKVWNNTSNNEFDDDYKNPFVLIYKDKWPQGFYDSEFNVFSMSEFITNVNNKLVEIRTSEDPVQKIVFNQKFIVLRKRTDNFLERAFKANRSLTAQEKEKLAILAETQIETEERKKKNERELTNTKTQIVSRAVSFDY